MSVDRPFRRSASLLVLLSIGAFAASQRDPVIAVVAGGLAIAAVRVTTGPSPRALPQWALRAGVLAAIAWGGFEFAVGLSAEGAPRVVGTVVLSALLVKLWSPKAAQDWRQVIALTIVLVVAASLSSMDLLVGGLVVCYAAAIIPGAMLYQIHAGEESAAAELRSARPGGAELAPPRPVPGTAWLRQLRWMSFTGIVLGAAASIAVFLMFPRAAGAAGTGPQSRTSGFRGEISLWGSGRISLSSRVAMTVQLLDPLDRPGELVRPLRMRGAALDRYVTESGNWVGRSRRVPTRVVRPPAGGGFGWFAPAAEAERSNVWTQVVEVRSVSSERAFSAWLPLGIASDEPRTFAFAPESAEILAGGATVLGPPRSYRVRVQPFPSVRIAQAVAAESPAAEVTFPVPRVRAIAESIIAGRGGLPLPTEQEVAHDPDERWSRNRRLAAAFADHLSGSDFRYTTDLSDFRRVEDADPVVLFLERYRFGHCEHFASALAALCLSMGVEARVVTGFMTTEYDASAERYVFRESGAHAWVEVRVGEWQWATYDASPMEELLAVQTAGRSWVDRFRWALDPVESVWNSRLASYDGRSQAELGARVAGRARSAGAWVAESAAELVGRTNRWFRLGPAGAIWLGSVAVTVVIAAVAAFVLSRRAGRAARELSAGESTLAARLALGRDAGFYLDALDELARAGLAKPPGRTPLAHAEAIAAANPAASEAFARTVEAFYRLRYQGVPSRRRDRVRARLLVGRLRSALRGR